MDIKSALAPQYVAAGRSDVNAKHTPPELDPHKAENPEETTEKSPIEEIREKGLTKYLEDLREEKKEELRKKILGEM